MLKRQIKNLEEVIEGLRPFYAPAADAKDGFILQVDGKPAETQDTLGALQRAKDHEKNLRVAAEAKVTGLEQQVTEAKAEVAAAEEAAKAALAGKGQDVQALEASWKQKLDDAGTKSAADIKERDDEIERLLISNTAEVMATEISTVPELFQDTIARRLRVEVGADKKRFVRVLDAEGNPSALTVDDLRKELVDNKKYAGIIISGKGSGGGAGGGPSGGGADEKKTYLDYSDTELTEMRRTDRPRYDKLLEAHRAAAASA